MASCNSSSVYSAICAHYRAMMFIIGCAWLRIQRAKNPNECKQISWTKFREMISICARPRAKRFVCIRNDLCVYFCIFTRINFQLCIIESTPPEHSDRDKETENSRERVRKEETQKGNEGRALLDTRNQSISIHYVLRDSIHQFEQHHRRRLLWLPQSKLARAFGPPLIILIREEETIKKRRKQFLHLEHIKPGPFFRRSLFYL